MLEICDVYARNILKGVNLTVKRGEFVLIVGENGAGKSTLFAAISASIKPTSGQVLINGQGIAKLSPRKRSALVANVLQDPKLGTIGDMTIFENMNIAYMRGKRRGVFWHGNRRRLFEEKLAKLGMGLETRLDEYARNLSGGQRQALSLVMSTLADYEVLLLDEITASLDDRSSELVMTVAQKIAEQDNKICLAITHDTEYIQKFKGRIVRLKNGKTEDAGGNLKSQ